MFRLLVKGTLAAALAFGTVNSFAQDFAGVTCPDGQCSCTNDSTSNPSSCCGITCIYSGGTCTCT